MTIAMRVAQVIDSLSTGGAERLIPVFATRAPELGVQCEVVSLSGPESTMISDQLAAASVPVTQVPSTSSHELLDYRRRGRLAETFRLMEPDVVHAHLEMASLLALPIARSLDIPTIVSLHSSIPQLGSFALAKLAALTRAVRRADKVLAVGPTVAELWRERLPGTTIDVLPNPVALPGLGGQHDRDEVTILSVSRLVSQKSIDVLVRAMSAVAQKRPDVRCLIAGDGPLRGEIENLIKELGLGDSVQLLGMRNDVETLYGASDIFVSSSTSEGMPLAILEAMAAGLPIVATRTGDVPAVVSEDAGIVVSPGSHDQLASALLAMIDDVDARHRCGLAARLHVQLHHDPDQWARRLHGLYVDLAGKQPDGLGAG